MPSFQELLAANLDDVTEVNNASPLTDANQWDSGRYGANVYSGGVRFIVSDGGVGPSSGDVITLATLTFDIVTLTSGGGAPSANIGADDVDNAPVWSNTSRPSQVTPTTAQVSFAPAGVGLRVATITSVVQEIVDRPGWVQGNAMRFAVMQTAPAAPSYFAVDAINDAVGAETVLDITYTPTAATSRPPQPASLMALQQRM